MQKVEGKQIVMLLAVGSLAIAFMFFQYIPIDKKTKELKAENTRLITENTAMSARQDVLPQLLEEIDRMKKQVGNFDAKIPVGRSQGLFLQNLASVMQKQGLTEIAVTPGRELETSELSQIPVMIHCRGKLSQIFGFFKALENFERVIQVEEIRLTADSKFDGDVVMEVKINIFYRTA